MNTDATGGPYPGTARLVAASLQKRGVGVANVDPFSVLDDRGRHYLVRRLAVSLVPLDDAERSTAVEQYLDELLGAPDIDGAERERLLVRIGPPPEHAHDALPYDGSLVLLPAYDRADVVRTVTEPARLGGWDVIWPVALENLRRLPRPHHTVLTPRSRPGVQAHVFEFADWFGASRALIADELLADVPDVGPPRHGLLVATPNRSTVLVHVIDGPDIDPALAYLAFVADQLCAPEAGPLSRVVSYRDGFGPVQPVAWLDEQRELRIDRTVGPFAVGDGHGSAELTSRG